MTDFDYCRVEPSGLTVGYVSRGSGPLVMFLHGFPDTHRGFLPAMDAVAAAGYRAVAPEPRGYTPTDVPADGDYRVEAFASDVVGIADALGVRRFSIVGHDWGALTAYAAANLAPTRVDRIVTAALPHTGHFLLNIGFRQALRSRYMAFFQLPGVSERHVARNDFAYLEGLLRDWSPSWGFGTAVLAPLRDAYSDPRRLTAALSYYRGLPASVVNPRSRRLLFAPVAAPTRILYGLDDGCIGAELFQRQESRFRHPVELVKVADCGHFIQYEQPGRFTDEVVDFLGEPHRDETARGGAAGM